MRTLRNHLPEIALIAACVTLLLSAFLFKLNHDQGEDIKGALAQIQQSRIFLSRQSCKQRNNERSIQRSNLRDNLAQLTQISDGALQQLGFTRDRAVAQIRKQLKQVAPLDCQKLVKQVAGKKKLVSRGGGARPSGAPRPPRPQTDSKVETGPGSTSPAPHPQRPSKPVTTPPSPPPGNGPSVGPPGQPAPEPSGGLVNTVKQTVGGVVDRVGRVFDDVLQPPVPGLP